MPACAKCTSACGKCEATTTLPPKTPSGSAPSGDHPGDVRPPGGESWHEVSARVGLAADRLTALGEDVIVVAHFGAILTQLQRATGDEGADVFGYHINNLSVTRLTFDGRWHVGEINHNP